MCVVQSKKLQHIKLAAGAVLAEVVCENFHSNACTQARAIHIISPRERFTTVSCAVNPYQ
jgi:hypothetical protein